MSSALQLAGSFQAKQFPLQLAQGVLLDLQTKELDALGPDADDRKKAAFEAAKGSLPRRLPLVLSQIAAADPACVAEGFGELVRTLTGPLFRHPILETAEPSVLDTSLWLQTLSAVFDAASAAAGEALRRGGLIVTRAILGCKVRADASRAVVRRLLAFLQWWGDDVCVSRWGVTDAWGFFTVNGTCLSPFHAITTSIYGPAALISFAAAKGCPVNGDFKGSSKSSPAYLALLARRLDLIEEMVQCGLDLVRTYEKDGWSAVTRLFELWSGPTAYLADLLRTQPHILDAKTSRQAKEEMGLLSIAIRARNPALVDVLLSAGAAFQTRLVVDGERVVTSPSLGYAIRYNNARLLELVITKGRALEDWKGRYDKGALGCISCHLAIVAISAYPSKPDYSIPENLRFKHHPEAMECLELVLSSGLVCPWDVTGKNALLSLMYEMGDGKCPLEDRDALALLKRYHAAGFEVLQFWEPSATPAPGTNITLSQHASLAGQPMVLDWCLGLEASLFGIPAEALSDVDEGRFRVLLHLALRHHNIACAMLLLQKYKVRLAYPASSLGKQPVVAFLQGIHAYTDAEAEIVLKALIERDPSIFGPEYFNNLAIEECEAGVQSSIKTGALGPHVGAWNPVYTLINSRKPRTLELLLKSNLRGIAAMASRPVSVYTVDGGGVRRSRSTSAQLLAVRQLWESLSLLLRHTDVRVTDSFDGSRSAADMVKDATGKLGGPPRALQILVEARVTKELAVKGKISAASQAAGAATNAFEEPAAKPSAQGKRKKQEKKKGGRKKLKAKKAAASGLGDSDSDSSSDGGEREDEPDDNLVDSSNAPSLDVMFAEKGVSAASLSSAAPADRGVASAAAEASGAAGASVVDAGCSIAPSSSSRPGAGAAGAADKGNKKQSSGRK